MPKKHHVYILECSDGTYYTGQTTNLTTRLRAHNGQLKSGAKYTRSRRPVKLVFSEEYSTASQALIREAQIKQMTRQQKEKLIKTAKSNRKEN